MPERLPLVFSPAQFNTAALPVDANENGGVVFVFGQAVELDS